MSVNVPKSPVLLLIFSRPKLTQRVLASIRLYRPERLYIVADGPRAGFVEDERLCEESRKAALAIDWDCDVKTLFRSENLGCGLSVKEGIDWFFGQESHGIILEDDTLPDLSFFRFCNDLLSLYENDDQVGQITGFRGVPVNPSQIDSFSFARTGFTWGWATWSRAWNLMDFEMNWANNPADAERFFSALGSRKESSYWKWAVKLVEAKAVDTWDYQWALSMRLNDLLTIVPRINLVKNVGFGPGATHTRRPQKLWEQEISEISFPLVLPRDFSLDMDIDKSRVEMMLDRRNWVLAIKKLRALLSRQIVDRVYLIFRKLRPTSR